MADKEICVLDVVPKVLPDLFLRGTFDVDQITADLNVRAVDDREIRSDLLDQRDEAGHLRVIYMGVQGNSEIE